jgi:1-aminocyclopropane-1-carboxylate deaminase
MSNIFENPFSVPLQVVDLPILDQKGISLIVKRLDLVHPLLSGNKFFKLKYNLQQAQSLGYNKILTFGGAYSNHIYATAAACQLLGIESIGVIRGEEHLPLNPTLGFAKEQGMHLHYINRTLYQNKTNETLRFLLESEFGKFYCVPEGGTNALAIQGTSEILQKEDALFDVICLPVGTGGTFAGVVNSLLPHQTAIGYSSLKGDFIHGEIAQLFQMHNIRSLQNWHIQNAYHFGGYGKFTTELLTFINDFYEQTGIPLDPIYTGKMMFGIIQGIEKGDFVAGQKVLALHTGGLQGNQGFLERHGVALPSK